MRIGRAFAWTVLLALASALEVRACGPYFPVSYFPRADSCGEYDLRLAFLTPVVSTNAAKVCFADYRVAPHLGTELAMIGAHYYPAWTGKAPKGNRISTAQADKLDFFAAGKSAGVSKEKVEEDWQRFADFNAGVCKRLEAGEQVELPQGIPDYALEFYLYKLGHAQWLVFRRDEDPVPFGQLLALPKERRLYRTVWVHFVRIANARKFIDKDRHVDALRKALDAGYKDTAALESFTLRFLSCTCGDRYIPLALTAYAKTKWKDWPGFAKRIFSCWRLFEVRTDEWVEKMCVDVIGVEVAIAYGAGGRLPADAVRPENPALGADRQAWIAFNRGELDLCRKLLALAPRRSLVRLFLEARLARLDGNYEKAAEWLHEWLEEYRRKGSGADGKLTGYDIGIGIYGYSAYMDYWYTGDDRDGWHRFDNTIHYSGDYGPSGSFTDERGECFRDFPASRSHEPMLARVVSGELGVVLVAARDLEEALYAFLRARNWIDVAFVAERCMTVDELVKFMSGSRIAEEDKELLRSLLMRRLMRCGRAQEASTWAPPKLKLLCDEFRALSAIADNPQEGADARAVASFNLSRLVATRGMELMGTELRPDVAIYKGSYASDELPLEEPAELSPRLGQVREPSPWTGWKVPEDRVASRFHYRRKAIAYAKTAAELAKDEDVRAWSLMLGGVVAMSLNDVPVADWFYKRLAAMHHPRAKVGGWFNSPEYWWFKDKYYDQERHAKPIRVPLSLTRDQLKDLKP